MMTADCDYMDIMCRLASNNLVTIHVCTDSKLLAIPQSIFNASCLQLIDLLFTQEDQRMRKRHESTRVLHTAHAIFTGRPAESKIIEIKIAF